MAIMRKMKTFVIIFLIVDIITAAALSLLIKDVEDEYPDDDIFSEVCPNEEYV
jgi:biotin transporter BioY